ncbi:MAG: hypothetical protein ACRD5R_11795 [Candidatus Acidiferrales bacterium]
MTQNLRPISVTLLAWLYIAVGAIGFIAHFTEIHASNIFRFDGIWIEVVEVLAIICGVFLLRGRNWARWLAIAWMAFHVAVSAYGPARELVIHSVLFVAFTWILYRAAAAQYFRGARIEAEKEQ